MNIAEILEQLKKMAEKDSAVRQQLLATENSSTPLGDFCALSTRLGYPLYEMDVLTYGEEMYGNMKRSTNGGGENSPKLEGQDDFYAMFLAELRAMPEDNA